MIGKFKPQFWPTVVTVPAIVIMIGLGIWQVQRLMWKNALIAEITAKVEAPVVDMPKGEIDPEALNYRHLRLTGVFDHDKEIYLVAHSLRGNLGYHILTPMRLTDGRWVIVNRGWVPQNLRDGASRPQGQLKGVVTLTGVARKAQKQGWMVPDNDPAKNTWFYVDPRQIGAALGIDVLPVVVVADKADIPGIYPLGGQVRITIPNNHLSYAITWFSLALVLAAIYVIWHLRREEDGREGTTPHNDAEKDGKTGQ